MDLEVSHFNLLKENQDPNHEDQSEYKEQLADSLFNGKMKEAKVLAFKSKAPTPSEGHLNRNRVLYTNNIHTPVKKVPLLLSHLSAFHSSHCWQTRQSFRCSKLLWRLLSQFGRLECNEYCGCWFGKWRFYFRCLNWFCQQLDERSRRK